MASQFTALLNQGPRFDSKGFWDSFISFCDSPNKLTGTLSAKGKEKLCDAIRYAGTTNDTNIRCALAVNKFILRTVEEIEFQSLFTQADVSFFTTLSNYVKQILLKVPQSYEDLKSDLFRILDVLYRKDCVFKTETLPSVSTTIINIVIGNRSKGKSLLLLTSLFLNRFIDEPCIREALHAVLPKFEQAITNCCYPFLQLRLINIACRSQLQIQCIPNLSSIPLNEKFNEAVHPVLEKINKSSSSIITLPISKAILTDGQQLEEGWIDIGTEDLLMIDLKEEFIESDYQSISSLTYENQVLQIFFDGADQDAQNIQETSLEVYLKNPISEEMRSVIFARLSNGESQNDYIVEQPPMTNSQRIRSSVAMYNPIHAQVSQPTQIDEGLFNESKSIDQYEVDSIIQEIPPPIINQDSESTEDIEEQSSPPPPIINDDEPIYRSPQKKIKVPSFELKVGQNNYFVENVAGVSEKIGSGLDALTKHRMDAVELFGNSINQSVSSFKDDIRTTMRDREHGTMKQLDSAKSRFTSNIQNFKRKEAAMHQNLIGYEDETKEIASKITEIQRRIRTRFQEQRLNLEEVLKTLRKQVRNQQESEDLNDFDDLDVPIKRKRGRKYRD